MGVLVIPAVAAGSAVSATDTNTAYEAIEAVVNGGLDHDNLSSSCAIPNAKLANPYVPVRLISGHFYARTFDGAITSLAGQEAKLVTMLRCPRVPFTGKLLALVVSARDGATGTTRAMSVNVLRNNASVVSGGAYALVSADFNANNKYIGRPAAGALADWTATTLAAGDYIEIVPMLIGDKIATVTFDLWALAPLSSEVA